MPDAIVKDVLESEEILLSTQVTSALDSYITELEGNIDFMRKSGMSEQAIKQTMIDDLERGGRMFSQIKSIPKNSVKSAINGVASEASIKVQQEGGVTEFAWVTISPKPCDDCLSRSGETGTIDFWRTVGRPRSGFSVCGTNCKCLLVSVKANPPAEVKR